MDQCIRSCSSCCWFQPPRLEFLVINSLTHTHTHWLTQCSLFEMCVRWHSGIDRLWLWLPWWLTEWERPTDGPLGIRTSVLVVLVRTHIFFICSIHTRYTLGSATMCVWVSVTVETNRQDRQGIVQETLTSVHVKSLWGEHTRHSAKNDIYRQIT